MGFSVQGQQVTLKLSNGDSVSGAMLLETNGTVRLRHVLIGEISIAASNITSRTVSAPPPVPPPAPPASSPTPSPVPVAHQPPAPKAPAPARWVFDIQAGADLGFGVADRQLYNARGKATYSKDRLRNTLDGMLAFGKTDGIKSADRLDVLMKTDLEIGGRYFLYNLGGVGYDDLRRINLRYETGPGLGYHLINKQTFKLNAEIGGHYQVHQYRNRAESESFFYRVAEDSVWQITPKLAVDQRFEFFPGVSDPGQFRFRFEGNLRYSLRSNIYLNLTALDSYDNTPGPGVAKNDVQLRSSLGLKF